jgi:membrane protease YdiL (CAAX protease family)
LEKVLDAHSAMLRSFWQRIFKSDWIFGVVMIFLFGIPRFIIVLHSNTTGNYSRVSLIFIFMWFAPFIFLTKKGRTYIGIKKPDNYYWLLYSFLIGILACAVIYAVGVLLYNHSLNNWYVYISKSTTASVTHFTGATKFTRFLILAIIGMAFSPIGEELFYRGIIHGSFVPKRGEHSASIIDSQAFALTHLAHFGIIYIAGNWRFLFIPSLLWMFFMFLASRLFYLCKVRTGSILGAIASHAGFNLAMMYFIFYHIL